MPFPPTHPALARALTVQGYAEPTPVQAAVLEAHAENRDLLVSAQTGSGKTVAFGLAFGTTLLGEAERFGKAALPQALVIAPTRELAIQVSRELTWLYADTGAVVVTCVGGMDARREQRALSAGVHIVVGTPGRLRDHLERGNLDLSGLSVVVLDEADEMLDLGFREDLEAILDGAPAERRTLLFSATIAKDIAALARTYQRDAVRIDTTSHNVPHGDIEYRAIRIAPNDLEHAVVNLLRYFEAPGALVFCATREAVRHLHASLRERGFDVVALSGELTQKERSDALQALRDGRARVCVATDVAARGLDLPDLGLVIHAELPANRAALLHRSGRTGRAGRKGVSVLLAPHTRRRRVEQLLASASIEATWSGPPTAEEIRAGDQQRLLNDPIFNEPAAEEERVLARLLLEGRGAEEVATALIRLQRARLPEPEELFDDGRGRETSERREPREVRQRPERLDPSETVWYRLSVGRAANADPKWLIPLICRLGHVTKPEIGQIRIFENETKFEIARTSEAKFNHAIANASDGDVKIQSAGAPGPRGERPAGDRPDRQRSDRPKRDPASDKPRSDKPRFEKPTGERKAFNKARPPWKSDKPRSEAPRADAPRGKPGAAEGGPRPPGKPFKPGRKSNAKRG